VTPAKHPGLTEKVERGLQALAEAAGHVEDKSGDVASARRWLAARLATRAQDGPPPGELSHQDVIDELVRLWEKAHKGRTYPFASRDAKAVREIRGQVDYTPEVCFARWGMLLADPWWRSRGVSIPDLMNQWTRLASKEANGERPSPAALAAAKLARRLQG
jgi:hypothetical protein